MDIKKLEAWYLNHHRKLPFRESRDPYQIWISEVMLQQTQMETVLPYFQTFLKTFPTIKDLAEASEDELHKAVEGLGYYRRFRLMQKAAKMIVEDYQGVFPQDYQSVRSLPGVGNYTAGAIMSIAFNQPYSATDGNVIRVLSRYLADDHDMHLEKNKKVIDLYHQSMIEKATPWIYTQAIMELGALVCRPKAPKCESCPLLEHCQAYQQGREHSLPIISKLANVKTYHYITLIIEDANAYYLRKRDEELLKGMYEYPQYEGESIVHVIQELEAKHVRLDIDEELKTYKHMFSHQHWIMHVYRARLIEGVDPSWISIPKNELMNYPMATAHRKIKRY